MAREVGHEIGRHSPNLPKKYTVVRIPNYSRIHPMIPRLYVPEWKTDMHNRTVILKNAITGGVPHYEHDEPLFWEKREQMTYNSEHRDRTDTKYVMPRRPELLRPPIYHRDSHFQSGLNYRLPCKDARSPPEADDTAEMYTCVNLANTDIFPPGGCLQKDDIYHTDCLRRHNDIYWSGCKRNVDIYRKCCPVKKPDGYCVSVCHR